MIPSTTNKLLITQDWKKIYQSFRNADFKSYDFETLRRTMITYLKENYPEEFNDFVDSSEYIALIDLIAYLGQNLSFRIDLNARENFLETAQRRESILRLARLINYNVRRNLSANGFLKVKSISTSEPVFDANGVNLASAIISWNDPTNSNWYQQFISIINSALPSTLTFGKPNDRGTINGIITEQYKLNSNNPNTNPIYSFTSNVGGTNMSFEVVPATFADKNFVYEETPKPGNPFSLLYRNDNRGASSSNTGFFVYFKQGKLSAVNFSIDTPVPNEIVGINAPNINDSDVWLWQLNADGTYPSSPWSKVPSTTGNNIIYNSLNVNERNIYAVLTREEDQIDLSFADGSFGNLPKGQFRVFYRQSNGLSYTISPEQISNVSIEIPYTNKSGQSYTLTLIVSLEYTVANSLSAESDDNVKLKAPQAYYTQNRMVTAEDYNIAPLTAGQDILKVKSVNRLSSGISKYFELSDVTGNYSKTNIFANDGIIYKDYKEYNFEFDFATRNEIYAIIKNQIAPIIASNEFKSFYLDQYPRINITDYFLSWQQVNKNKNQVRGYFNNLDGIPTYVGSFVANDLQFITPGSLIKFVPPAGKYFLPNGKLTSVADTTTKTYLWSQVANVIGDGSNSGKGALDNGLGPITLTGFVPTDAKPVEVIPKFVSNLSYGFETEIVNLCTLQRNFGLSFDKTTRDWFIISNSNLNLIDNFNLVYQKDVSNLSKDSSWLMAFEWIGKQYRVTYRQLDYVFESEEETGFFIDENKKNFDFVENTVVKDQIKILGINSEPTANDALGTDYKWQIDSAVVESDGYINPRKVKISFYDSQENGQIDDPDAFVNIVEPDSISSQTGYKDKFVYFFRLEDGLSYISTSSQDILAYDIETSVPQENLVEGQLYYFYDVNTNVVKNWSTSTQSFELNTNYFAKSGRKEIKFQYTHNSSEERRLDPSKSNIIDIFLLTQNYDTNYRNWLISNVGTEPLAPTSQSLEAEYSSILEPIKSISDEIIFNPAKYKVLFGSKAPISLQATFKAVRNPKISASENDIKSRIISAIEDFFNIENWDFGQTFYFSELSTYVMNSLTPYITNFVIVPKSENAFGSLYEIKCQSNEIFVNGATVNDIVVIDAITATELKSGSNIVTS